jgi:aminoglycoside phosphotransferase (APT) family kinase protein
MDWEQPSLGGALHDLAWWLIQDHLKVQARGGVSLPGLGGRSETIALWAQITGIATADIEWYEAFAALKLMCLGAHMMQLKGISPPDGDFTKTPWGRDLVGMLRSKGLRV